MGFVMPAAPLPDRPLHFGERVRMAQNVPVAGGESRSSRQGLAHSDWRA